MMTPPSQPPQPHLPVGRPCRRRQNVWILIGICLIWSLYISTSNVEIITPEDYDERESRREALEILPYTPKPNIFQVAPRIYLLEDNSFIRSISPASTWASSLNESWNPPDDVSDLESVFVITTNQPQDGMDIVYRDFEREWYTHCEPVLQKSFHTTCNNIHEMNAFESTSTTLLSMEGNWRSVWKAQDDAGLSSILKMLQLRRNYTAESFQAHELDVLVMDQLTGSPHITSSYGFCGQSVLTEIAESSGGKVIKNNVNGTSLTWKDRLRLGRDIAKGLAELHTLEPWTDYEEMIHTLSHSPDPVKAMRAEVSSRPTVFAHHDINTANMISLRPKEVQWNDFNLGILSKNDPKTGQSCPVPVRYEGPLWRSPEEIQNHLGHVPSLQPSDVYALGTLLYTVLTKHQPWTHLEEGEMTLERVKIMKMDGALPNLPEKYTPEKDPAKILWAATKACFRLDATERPTAHRVALGLGLALKRIQVSKGFSDEEIESLFSIKK